jgi:hypothetical protein
MIARCLPILLLRVPKFASHKSKEQMMRRNCDLFLRGSWPSLTQKAVRELTALNTSATSQKNLPQQSGCRSKFLKHEEVLRRARSLQYSRAMNLLRSPGLATEPGATIHEALRELHPQEDLIMDDFATPREVPIPRTTFDFIDGSWLRLQIERSKSGTAVDQWGWDSKEMWAPFKYDVELMDALAIHWARPLAYGYLPPRYRSHLAGGRLIALSKSPKPGIRPICISDALRRLVAKGLFAACKTSFTNRSR